MRLSIPLIHEVITTLAGGEAVKLADFIKDKVHVSEFKIADALNISVNQVRNLLYRLDEHNLVSFIRKKDKKKGWYEYYWTLDLVKVRILILERKREKIAELRAILKDVQNKQYYFCPNGCIRSSPEEVLELQFKCPECDSILKQEDIPARQEKIQQELKKLQAELQEAVQAVEVMPDLTIGLKKKKGAKQQKKAKDKKGKKQKQPKSKKKHHAQKHEKRSFFHWKKKSKVKRKR